MFPFQLTHFPAKLVQLNSLIDLKLENNRLTCIPFSIRRMKSLRRFSLAKNCLDSLPDSVGRMVFDTLDVSGPEMFSKQMQSARLVQRITDALRQPKSLLYQSANVVFSKRCISISRWIRTRQLINGDWFIFRLKYTERTVPMDVINVIEESPFCSCGQLTAQTEIVRFTSSMRIKARDLINSSKHVYGDSVYCDDHCKSHYLKSIFYSIDNFNEVNWN